MKFFKLVLFITLLIFPCLTQVQEELSSEQALNKYNELIQVIKSKKLGFFDEAYWSYYFQLTDLLEYITDDHTFVLGQYKNTAFNFRHLGLPKESIRLYTRFFKYYEDNEQFLTEEEKTLFIHYRSSCYGLFGRCLR